MNTGLNTSKPQPPLPYIRFVSVSSVVKNALDRSLGRKDQLFGQKLDAIIEELNKELTA
jgi:hypothetical protein